jgi:hypothetical protein
MAGPDMVSDMLLATGYERMHLVPVCSVAPRWVSRQVLTGQGRDWRVRAPSVYRFLPPQKVANLIRHLLDFTSLFTGFCQKYVDLGAKM